LVQVRRSHDFAVQSGRAKTQRAHGKGKAEDEHNKADRRALTVERMSATAWASFPMVNLESGHGLPSSWFERVDGSRSVRLLRHPDMHGENQSKNRKYLESSS
jgi:hypothetical protein